MKRGQAKRLGTGSMVIVAVLAAYLEMAIAGAWEPPSAVEIVKKFLSLRASAPTILVADATIALRARIPLTQPPTCVYIGKLTSTGTRYAINIEREVRNSLVCGLAASHRDNLIEVVRETVEAVAPLPQEAQAIALRLDRFDLSVRDQKVKGVGQRSDWFFLLDGKAKDPNQKDPSAFRGWIDYDEGVWEEGTLIYSWGRVDTKQKYTRLENAWVLAYQYLYSKQYDASFETTFSNFQFAR